MKKSAAARAKYTYRSAGVDLPKANAVLKRALPMIRKTYHSAVMDGVGGFAALISGDALKDYPKPVLVTGVDGVGTKIELLARLKRYDVAGWDAVAVCVNDLVTVGAKPLFFLDYYAAGEMDEAMFAGVLKGAASGCLEAECALVGGENAEMRGFYPKGLFDIAGFAVGVVDADQRLNGLRFVKPGDAIVGLAASGPHANGFTLIRRLLKDKGISLQKKIDSSGRPLGELLTTPTAIYSRAILGLLAEFWGPAGNTRSGTNRIHAAAHISGGGFLENVPRVLPKGVDAVIRADSWEVHPVFQFLQELGSMGQHEMFSTFNMGIGMVLIVERDFAEAVMTSAEKWVSSAWVMGEIVAGTNRVKLV
ncbi:MAG: phosphoribosylformylglycinamidine cyclo-ligase [bacterium]